MIPFELSTEESALVRGGFFRRSRENKGKTNMKQLKFMLAAATAIGLATAAQAATTPLDSEDFESAALKDDISKLTGFYYFGVAADNESEVVSDGASGQALKVNTGTVPVLRALKNGTGAAIPQSLKDALSVNVDTMVQFTVTPAGDSVTATSGDKLMIYLKETATTTSTGEGDEAVETTTYATNLVVKAAKYSEADSAWVEGGDDYVVTLPAGMEAVTTDKWYRLVVKAKAYVYGTDDDGNPNSWWPVFQVYLASATDTVIDADDLCTFEDVDGAAYAVAGVDTGDDAINSVFVSLAVSGADGEGVESPALALESVGFAGEGMVDNLVFTKEIEGATSVDFTFTWTTAGISSVTYTIGDADPVTVENGVKIENLVANTVLTIAITPADWYKVNDGATLTYTADKVGASADLDALVTKLTSKPDADGNIAVNPNATSAEIAEIKTEAGITGGAFAETTDATELGKALTWQSKNNVSGEDVSEVEFKTAEVTNVNGSVETVFVADGPAAEAYLLNCNPNGTGDASLQKAKDNFKFEASDLAKLFDVANTDALSFDSKNYNGSVILEGKEELSGEWKVKAVGHKFFRARLVK